MENKAFLKFLNHASFMIESSDSILLCDPWLEGCAFDNGWSLLDKSTDNLQILSYLETSKKSLFVWYSHEHSDHFSVKFLKQAKALGVRFSVILQKTLDRRVANFVKKMGFHVIELAATKLELSKNLSISVWTFSGGDSYALIKVDNLVILNTNDCTIDSLPMANRVRASYLRFYNEIDILFTQFGYANWIGNKEDVELRAAHAQQKIERIQAENCCSFRVFCEFLSRRQFLFE